MKKRILSLALIVAMVVAMIPAVLVPASAAPHNGYADGYDAYYSTTNPTLDGEMDAAYKNSEAVLVNHTHTEGVNFVSYFVVTSSGLYVYANVSDPTVDVAGEAAKAQGAGDKAQLYLQVANTVNATTSYDWGYYDCDYAHTTSVQSKNGVYVQSASKIVAGGYTIEMFASWNMWTILSGGISLENTKVYVGFQANSYTLDTGANTGLVVDNPNTMSYWDGANYGCSGTTAPAKYMIPLNPITTTYEAPAAADTNSYKSIVTTETITLDGKRDNVYLAAQPITQGHVSVGAVGSTTGFTTYIVAKDTGIYVFASIYDDTLDKATAAANGLRNQDGDKFQLYLQIGNNVWNRWGYIDFDYVNGGRNMVTPKATNGFDNVNKSGAYVSDKIQQKAVIWDDNKGWDIEIFIPNDFCVDIRNIGSQTLKNLLCKVNFQVLNETCTKWDANSGTATERNRYGLSYDVAGASGSWSGTSAYVPVDFSISRYTLPGSGAVTYGYGVTVDAVKDACYGDDSTAFILDRERSDNFTANNGDAYGKAWVVVTKDRITAYAEFEDSTLAATPSDAFCMYVYFPLTGTAPYYGLGYARAGHIETTSRWTSGASILHTEGDDNTNIGESGARKDLGNGKYAVEISISLPKKEREALANGETVNFGIGLMHKDRDASGTVHYNRNGYEYGWGNVSYVKTAYPTYAVNRADTATNMAVASAVTSANVALGDSIAMNYYATVPAYAVNPAMKFTMNGKSTFVYGVPTDVTNQYKFTFAGIAPQCMADAIDAELYIDGKATGVTKNGYSVVENLNNVKNNDNAALIYALANYGAAAQNYSYYKTGALVTGMINGYVAPSYSTIVNNDRTTGTPVSETVKLTALGVYFSGTNRIYAKFQADTLDGVEVYINGTKAQIQATKDAGIYIVYSEDIKVLDFDVKYTIEIVKGEARQTATYSVNAYAAAKQTNADYAYTTDLVKALYAYGVAAEAFVK